MPEGFGLCLLVGVWAGIVAGTLFYQLTVYVMGDMDAN
jgi:hypothetical protein